MATTEPLTRQSIEARARAVVEDQMVYAAEAPQRGEVGERLLLRLGQVVKDGRRRGQ